MSREIKFRIWNGESIEETVIDFSVDKETRYKEFYIYPDDIFMQYTGLKDKNGKEVYESDVVRDGYWQPMEVYFYHGCWMMRYVSNKNNYKNLNFYLDEIEVIGNIYENRELLDG